jgi:molybdate transport system substrate-binding protein
MKPGGLKLISLLMAGAALSGTLAGCRAPVPQPAAPVEISVAAAASLTDALGEVDGLYTGSHPNVTITPNFASSGTLQKQIEQGAPVDLFISAAATQMDSLQNENLIVAASRKNLLNNKVVLIVPTDSTLNLTSFSDLSGDQVKSVAIGDPKSVPAGTYGQQVLDLLGITAQVQPKMILGSDVRQVLNYVETGNVDAGIVYATDALVSTKVKVVANAPDEVNAKIVYPVAVIAASKNQAAAEDYEAFLLSTPAIAVFERYGFVAASK